MDRGTMIYLILVISFLMIAACGSSLYEKKKWYDNNAITRDSGLLKEIVREKGEECEEGSPFHWFFDLSENIFRFEFEQNFDISSLKVYVTNTSWERQICHDFFATENRKLPLTPKKNGISVLIWNDSDGFVSDEYREKFKDALCFSVMSIGYDYISSKKKKERALKEQEKRQKDRILEIEIPKRDPERHSMEEL